MQEINIDQFHNAYQPEQISNQTIFYEGEWRSQQQYDAVCDTPDDHIWMGTGNTLLSITPQGFVAEFYAITKLSHLGFPMIVYLN